MGRLAQGRLDTQLGGAGDRTSNLPVTSQPALPPELLPPDLLYIIINDVYFIIIHNNKLYRAEGRRFVCVLWLSKRICCAAKDDIGGRNG